MAIAKPLYDPPTFAPDTPDEIRRQFLYEAEDYALFAHVGYFVCWYAIVEFYIGTFLWMVVDRPRPEDFDFLIRGMDAKTKLSRLTSACKLHDVTIGPNLRTRLDHFQNIHVRLRNELVHSYLYWPDGSPLQVCSIGTLPRFKGSDRKGPPPLFVDGYSLFERGAWLNVFSRDLGIVANGLSSGWPTQKRTLEINDPVSGLPTGRSHTTPEPRHLAKSRKPARKRV